MPRLHPEIEEVATGSFRRRKPPETAGSGHVVKSLELAPSAFHDADGFRRAVSRVVNLGDDAITTGAVCGQLGVPAEVSWTLPQNEGNHWRPAMIERALRRLLDDDS